MTIVEANDVSFAYERDGARVLDRVSVRVPRGGIVGLLGPNGSGKTTLLRLMSGTLTPASGGIVLDGRSITAMPRREIARRIAVVPQETHSAFDFTALEIVMMGRYPHLGAFELEGAADLAIAREALAATGTGRLEARRFATLSGGEKQRVVIASALAQASEVLLLDEPTASLDLGFQLDIAALLTRLNAERGVTMVVSTHDLNLAATYADRVMVLKDGKTLADAHASEALNADVIRAAFGIEPVLHTTPNGRKWILYAD